MTGFQPSANSKVGSTTIDETSSNLALPQRANALRLLPDGEAAKLEEARHKPDTKMAPRHEDDCSEIDLRFGVAGNP